MRHTLLQPQQVDCLAACCASWGGRGERFRTGSRIVVFMVAPPSLCYTSVIGRVGGIIGPGMHELTSQIHRFTFAALIFTLTATAGWFVTSAQPRTAAERLPPAARPLPGATDSQFEFTFVRAVYTGLGPWGYYKGWNTDWPKADLQFMIGVERLTNIRTAAQPRTLLLTDPELFAYPFLYAVEVGHWDLTSDEAASLGEYLRRGGFLFCDDFWGSREWANFERNVRRVLPDSPIIELPGDHPLFHSYYDIERLVQTPNVGNALERRITHEQDGYVPHCRGIVDDDGRLMVVINWNTDLGDAWEWADLPGYPAKYSTYAYQVGINAIVYAMSH